MIHMYYNIHDNNGVTVFDVVGSRFDPERWIERNGMRPYVRLSQLITHAEARRLVELGAGEDSGLNEQGIQALRNALATP